MFASSKKLINWSFFAAFFILRLISFLSRDSAVWQNGLSLAVLLLLIFVFVNNRRAAFWLLIAELLLGGAGIYFQLFDISIRNILILVYLLLWFGAKLIKREKIAPVKTIFVWPLLVFFAWLAIAAMIGYLGDNGLKFIYQDLSPWLVAWLFFPALEFFKDEAGRERLLAWFKFFLAAEAIWTAFNFLLFRAGATLLHAAYYNWLRDIAAVKMTQVNEFYWRTVFPEQLLVVPLLLIFSALLLKNKKVWRYWPLVAGALILSLNISRAYLLGWLIGLLVLKLFSSWRDWRKIFLINMVAFAVFFFSINLISSRGHYLGLNMLGLRFLSALAPQLEWLGVTPPEIDVSADIRTALLPPIFAMIKDQPLFGQGLGQGFSYERQGEIITTHIYDWGFLEMWTKWGLVGLCIFLFIIYRLLRALYRQAKAKQAEPLWSGLFVVWLALAAINITTSTFFHSLGVTLLIITMAILTNSMAKKKI